MPTTLLTQRRDAIVALANRPPTAGAASVVATLIIGLNGFPMYGTFFGSPSPRRRSG